MVLVGTNRIKLVKVIVRIGCHLHHHLPMLKIIKMDKEQEELLDEAYEKWIKYSWNSRIYPNQNDKDIFINRIKTESNFSIHWGLKIEERELNDDELNIFNLLKQTFTKQITITYNDKTIESYE
jgi:hypothetical protein